MKLGCWFMLKESNAPSYCFYFCAVFFFILHSTITLKSWRDKGMVIACLFLIPKRKWFEEWWFLRLFYVILCLFTVHLPATFKGFRFLSIYIHDRWRCGGKNCRELRKKGMKKVLRSSKLNKNSTRCNDLTDSFSFISWLIFLFPAYPSFCI